MYADYFAEEVAPLAGAWIEIRLKGLEEIERVVAPLAGAWIEMILSCRLRLLFAGRSPRGSVD